MTQLIKCCGKSQFTLVSLYKIVWQIQAVQRARLKFSMERNRILLVNYHSLGVSHMSLKGKILRNR